MHKARTRRQGLPCWRHCSTGGLLGKSLPRWRFYKWQNFSTLSSAWSDWSQWTSCSRTCGAGSRSRGRECKNATAGQSDSCQGEKLQAETCQDTICPSTSSNALLEREGKAIFILTFFIPVDGIWLNWGEWSSCGVSWVRDSFKFWRSTNIFFSFLLHQERCAPR